MMLVIVGRAARLVGRVQNEKDVSMREATLLELDGVHVSDNTAEDLRNLMMRSKYANHFANAK